MAKAQRKEWKVKFAEQDDWLRDEIFSDGGDSELRDILSGLDLLVSLREIIITPELMREHIRDYLEGVESSALEPSEISWSWLMDQNDFTPFEKLRLVYRFDNKEKYKTLLKYKQVQGIKSPEGMAFQLWQGLRGQKPGVLKVSLQQFLETPRQLNDALALLYAYLPDEVGADEWNRLKNAFLSSISSLVHRDADEHPTPSEVITELYKLLRDTVLVTTINEFAECDVVAELMEQVDTLGFNAQVRAARGIELPQEVDTALKSDEPSLFTDFFEMRKNLDTLKVRCCVETDSSASADIIPKTPTEQAYDLLMGNPPREGYEVALDSIDGQILMDRDMAVDVLIRFCKKHVLAKLDEGELEAIFLKIMPSALDVYYALLRANEKGLWASEMPGRVLDVLAARKEKAKGDSSRPLVSIVTEALDDKKFTEKLFILGPAVGINTPLGAVIAQHRNEWDSRDTYTRKELLEIYNGILLRPHTITWDGERKDADFILKAILAGQLNVTDNRVIKLNGLADEFLRLFLKRERPENIFDSLITMHELYTPHVAFAFDALLLACIQLYQLSVSWHDETQLKQVKAQLDSIAEEAGLQTYLDNQFDEVDFKKLIQLEISSLSPQHRSALVDMLGGSSMRSLYPAKVRAEIICQSDVGVQERLGDLMETCTSRRQRGNLLKFVLNTLGLGETFFHIYEANRKRIPSRDRYDIANTAGRQLVLDAREVSFAALQAQKDNKFARRYLRSGICALFYDCENCDSVEAMPEFDAVALAKAYPNEYTAAVVTAAAIPWKGGPPEVKHQLAEALFSQINIDKMITILKTGMVNEDQRHDFFHFLCTTRPYEFVVELMAGSELVEPLRKVITQFALSTPEEVRDSDIFELIDAEFVFGVFFENCDTVDQVIYKIASNQDALKHLQQVTGITLAEEYFPELDTDVTEVIIPGWAKMALVFYSNLLQHKYGLDYIYTEKERFREVLDNGLVLDPSTVSFPRLRRNQNFTLLERARLIYLIAMPEDAQKEMAKLAESVLCLDDLSDEERRLFDVWLRLNNQFDLAELLKLEIDDNVIATVRELEANNILNINQTPFGVLFDPELYAATPLEDIVTLLLDLTNPVVAEVLCALRNVSQANLDAEMNAFLKRHHFYDELEAATTIIIPQRADTGYVQSNDELSDQIVRFLKKHNLHGSLDSAIKITIPQRAQMQVMQPEKAGFGYVGYVGAAFTKFKFLELSMPEPGQMDWPTKQEMESIQNVMSPGITIDLLRALRVVRQYEHEHPGHGDELVLRILAAMPNNNDVTALDFLVVHMRQQVESPYIEPDLETKAFVFKQYIVHDGYRDSRDKNKQKIAKVANWIADLFLENKTELFQALYLISQQDTPAIAPIVVKVLSEYKKDFDVSRAIKNLAQMQPSFKEQCDVYTAALSSDTLLGQVVRKHRKAVSFGLKTKAQKDIQKNFVELLEGDIFVSWPGEDDTQDISSVELLGKIRAQEEVFAESPYCHERIDALALVILKEILLLENSDLKDLGELDHLFSDENPNRDECLEAKEQAWSMFHASMVKGDYEVEEHVKAGSSGLDDFGHAMTAVVRAASTSTSVSASNAPLLGMIT